MMAHKDCAFPLSFGGETSQPECSYGMTLRDYFAAKAMQGMLAERAK